MSRVRRSLAALTFVVGLLFALASPAGAIINGEADGPRHPYVGIIFNDSIFCTATAIGPRVLVTASHCLEGGDFSVSFAEHPQLRADGWPDATAPGLAHGTAVDVTDWCGHTGTCGPGLPGFADADVAVVVLDAPVSLARYATLPEPGLVDSFPGKQAVTLTGYGVNRIARGGGQPVFVAEVARRTVDGELLPIGTQLEDGFLKYQVKGGSSGMCFGDSGGPVLRGDTIIGVNSFLNGRCSSFDVGTRLDEAALLAKIRSFQ